MAQPISIRLPDHITAAQIDEKAKELGMSRAAFIINAIENFLGFDNVFYEKIERQAKKLNIPMWLVIQNKLIKQMAKDAAKMEIWGVGAGPQLLEEFMFSDQGPITGEELFESLKKMYVPKEESKLVAQLLKMEEYGDYLTDRDKAVLIKNRAGRAWLESEEYKKEQQQMDKFEQIKTEYDMQED